MARKLGLGLIFCLAMLVRPSPAPADCASQCADAYGGYQSYNYTTCYQLKCSGRASRPIGSYGAVAFSLVDGGEGISWNKHSQEEANAAALASCAPYGKNCRIVSTYIHTCAAFAVAQGAVHFVVTTASSLARAKADAGASCKQKWGYCLVDMSHCSP